MFYSYELDSVRNSDSEVSRAFDHILCEKVCRDKDVLVLTFNQLADSYLILSMIKNYRMRADLILLLQQGRIKVSRYGNINTSIDYFLTRDSSFIYSALEAVYRMSYIEPIARPIIIEHIKQALQAQNLATFILWLLRQEEFTITNEQVIYLSDFVDFLLDITGNEVYLEPKKGEKITFEKCMYIAYSVVPDVIVQQLQVVERKIRRDNENIENRSNWHKHNKLLHIGDNSLDLCKAAETVIDTVYNIVCESSIEGIGSIVDCKSDQAKRQYFSVKYDEVKRDYASFGHRYTVDTNILYPDLHIFSTDQMTLWEKLNQ